jgi:predicted metal-dependent RNase
MSPYRSKPKARQIHPFLLTEKALFEASGASQSRQERSSAVNRKASISRLVLVDEMTKLTFYGGVNEIGDNKILVEDKKTKLFFDLRIICQFFSYFSVKYVLFIYLLIIIW